MKIIFLIGMISWSLQGADLPLSEDLSETLPVMSEEEQLKDANLLVAFDHSLSAEQRAPVIAALLSHEIWAQEFLLQFYDFLLRSLLPNQEQGFVDRQHLQKSAQYHPPLQVMILAVSKALAIPTLNLASTTVAHIESNCVFLFEDLLNLPRSDIKTETFAWYEIISSSLVLLAGSIEEAARRSTSLTHSRAVPFLLKLEKIRKQLVKKNPLAYQRLSKVVFYQNQGAAEESWSGVRRPQYQEVWEKIRAEREQAEKLRLARRRPR